eukprot:Filipodium_phascolosomae@DN987_c0_g1_i1.p1
MTALRSDPKYQSLIEKRDIANKNLYDYDAPLWEWVMVYNEHMWDIYDSALQTFKYLQYEFFSGCSHHVNTVLPNRMEFRPLVEMTPEPHLHLVVKMYLEGERNEYRNWHIDATKKLLEKWEEEGKLGTFETAQQEVDPIDLSILVQNHKFSNSLARFALSKKGNVSDALEYLHSGRAIADGLRPHKHVSQLVAGVRMPDTLEIADKLRTHQGRIASVAKELNTLEERISHCRKGKRRGSANSKESSQSSTDSYESGISSDASGSSSPSNSSDSEDSAAKSDSDKTGTRLNADGCSSPHAGAHNKNDGNDRNASRRKKHGSRKDEKLNGLYERRDYLQLRLKRLKDLWLPMKQDGGTSGSSTNSSGSSGTNGSGGTTNPSISASGSTLKSERSSKGKHEMKKIRQRGGEKRSSPKILDLLDLPSSQNVSVSSDNTNGPSLIEMSPSSDADGAGVSHEAAPVPETVENVEVLSSTSDNGPDSNNSSATTEAFSGALKLDSSLSIGVDYKPHEVASIGRSGGDAGEHESGMDAMTINVLKALSNLNAGTSSKSKSKSASAGGQL